MKITGVEFRFNAPGADPVAVFDTKEFAVASNDPGMVAGLLEAYHTGDDITVTSRTRVLEVFVEEGDKVYEQGYVEGYDEGSKDADLESFDKGRLEGARAATKHAGILGYEEAKQAMSVRIDEQLRDRVVYETGQNGPINYMLAEFDDRQLRLIQGYIKSFFSPAAK